MPKRTQAKEESEDEHSSEGERVSPPPAKKAKTAKKESKKEKAPREPAPVAADLPVGIQTNDQKEQYIALSGKRRATARVFKGQAMLDLREFYVKDGKTLPGSKGISLSLEQWTLIKESVGLIDEMIEGLKTEAS